MNVDVVSPKSVDAARRRIIVALDTDDLCHALDLARLLAKDVGAFKVGKQLFVSNGPEAVRAIQDRGGKVFLDLKFHDIPNTVAQAVRAAARMGVWMTNVHASGGAAMLKAAAEAASEFGDKAPLVVGVTVLTSLDDAALAQIGVASGAAEQVLRLARLAQEAGLAGVVASPREVSAIRTACGPDFVTVIPGVRPAGVSLDDQKRTDTPAGALGAGAHYLVVGRPITAAADPLEAARSIARELAEAMARGTAPA